MPVKIIIDTDPGCDDAIALIAALKSPLLDVRGITSIGGNVSPLATQHNARAICALVGRDDVAVYAGSDRPLKKPGRPLLADHIHGEDGLHGLRYPKLPPAPSLPRAHDFILEETLRYADDPLTIISIGAMTNIASAFLKDKTLPLRVKEIISMGGAFGNPQGNITPFAEFNLHCDPHAAKIVYDNFPRIRTFPLDLTYQTLQDEEFRDWLRGYGVKGANIAHMLEGYAVTSIQYTGFAQLHDYNTIAALVEPDIYTYRMGRVEVTEEGGEEGRTTFISDPEGNVLVAESADLARYKALRKQHLAAYLGQNA